MKYFFCDTGLKTQYFTKNEWAHERFGHSEILQFLKANIAYNLTGKELKISPIIKSQLQAL